MDGRGSTPASSRHSEAARKKKLAPSSSEDTWTKALHDLKRSLGDKYTAEDGLELLARLEEKQRRIKFFKGMRPVDVDSLFLSRAAKRARKKRFQEVCYKLAEKEPVKKSPKGAASNELAMPTRSQNSTTPPNNITQELVKGEDNGDRMEM